MGERQVQDAAHAFLGVGVGRLLRKEEVKLLQAIWFGHTPALASCLTRGVLERLPMGAGANQFVRTQLWTDARPEVLGCGIWLKNEQFCSFSYLFPKERIGSGV